MMPHARPEVILQSPSAVSRVVIHFLIPTREAVPCESHVNEPSYYRVRDREVEGKGQCQGKGLETPSV